MSSTYSITRDQIITAALIKLGVIEIGDVPDPATIAHLSLNLNLLIKQMATDGLKIWKTSELVFSLTQNKVNYIMGGPNSITMYDSYDTTFSTPVTDKPLKVIQAFYRNNLVTPPIDVPLQILSKQEYNVLGSKQSTGVANSIFYDLKQNYGILSVYLDPNAFVEANYSLHVVVQLPMNDLLRGQDIPDFPNEWMNCLMWNLCDQVALDYQAPQNHRQEFSVKALLYKNQMTDFDVESTSTFFQPDLRMKNYNSGNIT